MNRAEFRVVRCEERHFILYLVAGILDKMSLGQDFNMLILDSKLQPQHVIMKQQTVNGGQLGLNVKGPDNPRRVRFCG
jgi:hypothetical protein